MHRLFWLISAFYFWFFAIIGVYVIYMPKVLELKGYSPLEIGIVFAMSPLMRFLTPFFFLRRFTLDKKIYKASLLLSLLAGLLFFPTIENFWLFLIPNILLGISFALSLPYVETIALAKIGKEHYGKSRLFGSIGFIVVALGLAPYMDEPDRALWTLFVTILMTSVVGWMIEEEATKKSDTRSLDLKKYWWLWANFLLMQISFGPFYNFFTIYESQHGLDYKTISYLWTVGVIAEIIMLYFQAPLMRGSLLRLLQLSTLLTSFRWLLFHLFPDSLPVLYFAQTLHAFSFALYYSAAISYLYEIYPNKTLAQQFFGGVSFGLGGMLGSLFAGLMYGDNLFLYASFVAFLAFLVITIPNKYRIK
ncbi:MAG: MFS transporter [Epsilonproteobacteria bacterium]|nr:MFS transporter [Campylobacterota bacterium]NPA63993.1 MFS transporter [Campylobacterota bacterium]